MTGDVETAVFAELVALGVDPWGDLLGALAMRLAKGMDAGEPGASAASKEIRSLMGQIRVNLEAAETSWEDQISGLSDPT